MTAPHHVVVVGGGVLGTSAAAHIAESGSRVTLVTDGPRVTHTSAASFAWVNANADDSAYAEFKAAGRAEHVRQGSGQWFVQTGSDVDGVVTKEDGYVDVERFIAAHRARLLRAGGAVHVSAHVQRLDRRADKIIVEYTASDAAPEAPKTATAKPDTAMLEADTVVLAAGSGTAELARSFGADTRRIGTATGPRGFLARVRLDHGLTSIRSVNGMQLRPDGPGILAAQSLTLEDVLRDRGQRTTADTVWEPLRREISAALKRDVPRDALIRIDGAARPMAADGRPVAGWIADGVYVLLSHSGITLAPLLAELVARDLSERDLSALHGGPLGPYRPVSLIG